MPTHNRAANLHEYPTPIIHSPPPPTHVSIGDIHGNALKLIYTLVEEGVLKLNASQYYSLYLIYLTPTEQLTQEQLLAFKEIISNATVNSTQAITLIGDELADRGRNDYFTLLVLQKLKKSDCDIDIMLSNHSMAFMEASEEWMFDGYTKMDPRDSLEGMKYLLKHGLIEEQEIRTMVDETYIPMVKAIGYTISPDGQITLFSHAPIGLETVEALANTFGITYKENTIQELIQTIDAINGAINNAITNKPGENLVALFQQEKTGVKKSKSSKTDPISVDTPLKRLTWNRALGDELKTETASGIKVNFVHGHIGEGAIKKNGKYITSHKNLDNNLGKFNNCFITGWYDNGQLIVSHFTLYSSDLTKKTLTPLDIIQIQHNYNMSHANNGSLQKTLSMKEAVSALKPENNNNPDSHDTSPVETPSPPKI